MRVTMETYGWERGVSHVLVWHEDDWDLTVTVCQKFEILKRPIILLIAEFIL